jgi:phosphate transport system substrate-binding protein
VKITRIAQVGAVAAVAALALAGCAANEAPSGGGSSESTSELSGTLNATGASSQDAAEQAWIASFQDANPDVTINYQATGSGVGRDNFLEGASDFIGSDRAYNSEEISAGGWADNGVCTTDDLVEVPVYISPVAVIFNLPGVDSLNLTGDLIGQIFNQQITTWNDPAIAEINPDADLPDTAISPVHRSDPSGTSETFTSYLEAVAPEAWPYEASDEWPITGGEAAQGTAGVVAAVSGGEGTIGYADASQAGDLGTVAIEVEGEYVPYSSEAASALVSSSPLEEGRGEGDLVFAVDPASAAAGSYPIALVSYLIACEQYEDENTAALVRDYFTYVASPEGQDVAAEAAGSAPISDDLRDQINTALELIS